MKWQWVPVAEELQKHHRESLPGGSPSSCAMLRAAVGKGMAAGGSNSSGSFGPQVGIWGESRGCKRGRELWSEPSPCVCAALCRITSGHQKTIAHWIPVCR